MVVEEIISKTKKPVTKIDLIKGLRQLEIGNSELLMVYADLSKFDFIIGGAQTVIEAIYEVVGFHTTIVMPSHCLTGPCPTFFDETLPKKWQATLKKQMPAFDANLSPIHAGEVASAFAKLPNVHRSQHPVASFIVAGRKADWYVDNHRLNSMFGEHSPLQKLYAQDAKILCLGIDYEQLTALHLAEYFSNCRPKVMHEAVIMERGKRTLIEYEDLALNSGDFAEVGLAYEQSTIVNKVEIGQATCMLHHFRPLIDFTTEYLSNKN